MLNPNKIRYIIIELIDTQWDVNTTGAWKDFKDSTELIDTQWDVNDNGYLIGLNGEIELIDTQWDVNVNDLPDLNDVTLRINRYIVGCKYIHIRLWLSVWVELIDTQWDVNFLVPLAWSDFVNELIDTQWDVNE